MALEVIKDKTTAQLRKESKELAKQVVDLTVHQGMTQQAAVEAIGCDPEDIQGQLVQTEIRRLLRREQISNEQLNNVITQKVTELMLTAEAPRDAIAAAKLLTSKKELNWAPSEKVAINIGLFTENSSLLDEVTANLNKYMPAIDAEFTDLPLEADERS